MPPRRILIATDFSNPSMTALAFGARVARHCRASLYVLHVVGAVEASDDLIRDARHQLAATLAGVEDVRHCSVHAQVATGSAVDVILGSADTTRADPIVVGSRDLGNPVGPTFGSMTEDCCGEPICRWSSYRRPGRRKPGGSVMIPSLCLAETVPA
jgi:nucleotide-binding universal stress UspA family protein